MSALIIPCYVGRQWDLDCLNRLLDSVHGQTKPFEKVYVVDDASPIKHAPNHQSVEHIVLDKNGGPARARNVAISKALQAGIEHLLFTDCDCILDREWNEQMTTFLARTVKGVSPRIVTV